MHTKVARRFMLSLVGVALGFVAIPCGCGSSQEGTSVQYSPEADKKRLDSMREYMNKKKSSPPGSGKGVK